jgi:hypothetical protein
LASLGPREPEGPPPSRLQRPPEPKEPPARRSPQLTVLEVTRPPWCPRLACGR